MPRDQNPTPEAPPPAPAIVGIPAALAALRDVDEGAQVIWKCKGPRGTNSELAGVLFKVPNGGRIIVIVHAQERGSYTMFFEAQIPKGGEAA